MVANPEKEIRFTRSGQARLFALLGSVAIATAFTFVAPLLYGHRSPVHWAWTGPPLLLAGGFFWLSFYCGRHAFLILSPVGIEFFPLIRPSQNFRLWSWAEFDEGEVKKGQLCLHLDVEKTSGAIISLAPMTAKSRALFTRAIEGRMEERRLQRAEEN